VSYQFPSLAVTVGLVAGAQAGDWPQWRGPDRNGASQETVATNWGEEGPKLLWRAFVGTGFSSIAVSDGRVYTMGNATNQDTIWCFDARTGKERWQFSYAARPDPQWYEGGPGATPAVDHSRVFTISKCGNVFCFDAEKGNVVWQRDLK